MDPCMVYLPIYHKQRMTKCIYISYIDPRGFALFGLVSYLYVYKYLGLRDPLKITGQNENIGNFTQPGSKFNGSIKYHQLLNPSFLRFAPSACLLGGDPKTPR